MFENWISKSSKLYSSILLILMTSLGCIFYVHSRTTGITGNFLYDVLVRCFFVARAWVFFFLPITVRVFAKTSSTNRTFDRPYDDGVS